MAADERYWREVLSGERKGAKYTLMRGGLGALEALYAAGLGVYLSLERVGLRNRQRAEVPVISVGNLSVGGVGKTPMTQWLARRFQTRGYRPVIVSRGHGGSLSPSSAIVSGVHGEIYFTAEQAGDEPLLLAKTLPGVPVIVGKDRRVSVAMAHDAFVPNVLLLDDGFQYWQLARELDLVLLDAFAPFDNGHALPRGFLREPKIGLGRAGMVVLTRSDRVGESEIARVRDQVGELAPGVPVFTARHVCAGVLSANQHAVGQVPGRALLVCGIAQPSSFAEAVEREGIEVAGEPLVFPDHQSYGDEQARLIVDKLAQTGAASVITTEKDAVKMADTFLNVPLFTLRIRMQVEDEELFWETVLTRAGLSGPSHA